jgi:Tfp pilus assembly protein PilV
MRQIRKCGNQQGIALLTVLLLLVLLSALALGLMYMSSTETLINSNFRTEQSYYFAAKAGMEELRDRMMASNAHSISAILSNVKVPNTSGTGIYYMFNGTAVNPWDASSQYFDSELCHDGYAGLSAVASDLPCTSAYTGTAYGTVSLGSQLLWNGTSAALPFKWVRLATKVNGSVPGHMVNSAMPSANLVCWNGVFEQVSANTTDCNGFTAANPVYLVTALAASSDVHRKMRKMVQGEIGLQPAAPFPYGLFATGNGCGAVTLGGGATTDSFTTASGQTYSGTHTNTGGDVGSNGNTLVKGGSSIGGSVGSPVAPASQGSCPATLTVNGNGGMVQDPNNLNQLLTSPVEIIPTPTVPNTSGTSYSTSNPPPNPLPPGNYGNISLNSSMNLTLNAGVYNMTSLSVTGQATVTINGAVTLNIVSTSNTSPLDLEGGGFTNTSGIANNFTINYAGPTGCTTNPCGSLKVAGGATSYLILDAPNSAVTLAGNSDFYGAVIGNTIDAQGGAKFHYDRNTKSPVPSNSYYSLISFRDLPY